MVRLLLKSSSETLRDTYLRNKERRWSYSCFRHWNAGFKIQRQRWMQSTEIPAQYHYNSRNSWLSNGQFVSMYMNPIDQISNPKCFCSLDLNTNRARTLDSGITVVHFLHSILRLLCKLLWNALTVYALNYAPIRHVTPHPKRHWTFGSQSHPLHPIPPICTSASRINTQRSHKLRGESNLVL